MNFIKGIVDGILATDSEGTHRSKHQYDPDEPEYDSEGYERADGSKYRIHSNDNIHLTSSVSHLSELYKSERDNCLNSLIIRYGEGCVQQLSELLKSNHETIVTLSQQLQNNLSSLKEVNDKLESAAIEHIRLKNENNNLVQRLQQLSSENVGLKSQLTQADITIRSNEKHILSLNELLKDNKSTFENMKERCGEFYNLKHEIEELKKKLALSENHVVMLKKERDEYWSDPNRVLKDEEYKKRILQALDREDRSIAVAKLMASQTANLTTTPKVKAVDSKVNEVDNQLVSELAVRVEKLEYENAHLKEINDSLHTMYADLSKNMNEVKNTYLKESIDAFTSYFPPKTRPIQLVFVQPTGVLDLEFNSDSLPSYLDSTHSMHSGSPASAYHQNSQLLQSTSDSFKGSQAPDSSSVVSRASPMSSRSGIAVPTSGFEADSAAVNVGFREPAQPPFKNSRELSEPQQAKKASPKMNFRSKVINYVTKLDSSPRQQSRCDQTKLLDLDSPQTTRPSTSYDQALGKHGSDVLEPQSGTAMEPDTSKTWNSDWDFFDEPNSDPSVQPLTVSQNPTTTGNQGEFDLILDEESEQSQSQNTLTTQTPDVAPLSQTVPSSPPVAELSEHHQQLSSSVKAKKGWDDIDFDDEMFQ